MLCVGYKESSRAQPPGRGSDTCDDTISGIAGYYSPELVTFLSNRGYTMLVQSSKRILYIESDTTIVDSVTSFVERERTLTIDAVSTAREAEEILDKKQIDCLLCSTNLPETNAIEFLEEVNEDYSNLPVILFTASEPKECAAEIQSAAITDYVKKEETTAQYRILLNRLQNVIETRHARKQVVKARQRFESLSKAYPDVVFYIDRTGRYVDVIAGTDSALLREEADQLRGARLHEKLPSEKADRFLQTIQSVLDTNEIQTIQYRLDVQGERWFEARVSPMELSSHENEQVLWVARDITEQKAHERSLETLHDMATTIQTAETIDEVCQLTVTAAEEILEFELCSVLVQDGDWLVPRATSSGATEDGSRKMRIDQGLAGTTFQTETSQVVDEIEPDDETDPAKESYRSGLSVPIGEHGVFQAVSTEPAEFDAQEVTLAELLVSHANTAIERIERERTLRRKKNRLDEFASIVSHDLRNPLNVANLRLDLLENDCESPHLEPLENALNRMENLVEDVLTLARQGETIGELESVNVEQIVRNSWQTVETKEATVECDCDNVIRADTKRLAGLFENLFRNAVEHGGESVGITFEE